MRRCPKCDNSKPDANFVRYRSGTREVEGSYDTCIQCRSPQFLGGMLMKVDKIPGVRPLVVPPSEEVLLARAEKERIRARGRRVIERPYLRTEAGHPNRRAAKKRSY